MKEINSLDDILTKDGRINSAITRRPWFKETFLVCLANRARYCSAMMNTSTETLQDRRHYLTSNRGFTSEGI
jgi:hypothetical protein